MKRIPLFVPLFSFLAASGQTGSEIFLFEMKEKDGKILLSGGRNITNHKGYDNQPFFHPSKPVIYYSSFNDSGRSDIRYHDFEKYETKNLTVTDEREYSPTVTPDGQYISCIIQRDNGAQDLGKYPVKGGKPEVLISDLVIGYHAWANRDNLMLFVLGDSNRNTLHYYNLVSRKHTVIATGIGRSLHKIPGEHAMSFVHKVAEKEWLVKKFDLVTEGITIIAATLPGREDLAWLSNNTLLMSDGNQLFSYRAGSDAGWQPVAVEGDTAMLKGVTRLAVNGTNTKVAVVVSE